MFKGAFLVGTAEGTNETNRKQLRQVYSKPHIIQWQSAHDVLTVPGEDADISRTGSWDMAMEARKSSTCLRDRELWRVSKGQIEGTMEYNSKPSMKYTRISESRL